MTDDEIIFQFKSRPQYDFVTVLVIWGVFISLMALGLCRDVGKNCQMAIPPCSVGPDVVAGFVSLVVLSADILICIAIPWFLPGAFRLLITPDKIDMFANGSRIRFHNKDIPSYGIEIMSYVPTRYSGQRPFVDFRNWARGAPEYSSSVIHFEISTKCRTERYSFPLGYYFFQTPDVQARLEAALKQVGVRKAG